MQPSAVQYLQPLSHEFRLRALAQIQSCSKLHFGHQCNLDRKALNSQVHSSSVPILRGQLIIQNSSYQVVSKPLTGVRWL